MKPTGLRRHCPALERLRRNSIPLVLCSSKTAAELRAIRKSLDNRHPFIVENGGGIYLPVSGSRGRQSFEKLALGKTRSGTLQVLKSLRDRQQYDFTGFADMTRAELMGYTGLDAEQAKLAMRREYTEPIPVAGQRTGMALFLRRTAAARPGLRQRRQVSPRTGELRQEHCPGAVAESLSTSIRRGPDHCSARQ